MSTNRHDAAPPGFLQRFFGQLLPPDRREQVLGDLEERYREADPAWALWQYLFDAALLVPVVFWRERRRWHISASPPSVLRPGSDVSVVRRQAQAFQQETYCRFLFYSCFAAALSILFAGLLIRVEEWFPRLVAGAYLVVLMFTVYQHGRRGGGRTLPGGDSLSVLVEFHRRELVRRRDFLLGLWYWKVLPLCLPIFAIVTVEREKPELSAAAWMAVWFTLMVRASRRHAREVQRRIDALDRDWNLTPPVAP